MKAAFEWGFGQGYDHLAIIGSDCLENSTAIIERAFMELKTNDAVIGEAKDGGYYLLGMNRLYAQFFENKQWSTATVAQDTIQDFQALNLNYAKLPILSDVDYWDDLPESAKIIIVKEHQNHGKNC